MTARLFIVACATLAAIYLTRLDTPAMIIGITFCGWVAIAVLLPEKEPDNEPDIQRREPPLPTRR